MILAPLLGYHSLWPHFKRSNAPYLGEAGLAALFFLINEVTRGYSPPLPLDQARNIAGLSLQPTGVTIQSTINEQNAIDAEKRLTHDSTFEVLASVSSRRVVFCSRIYV
jgi:hypothetical protein